jgi:hypothetical protein
MTLQVQPTIDQVRIVTGTCVFDLVHHQQIIPVTCCDGATLVDVAISLNGTSTPYVSAVGIPFGAVRDVRLYLRAERQGKEVSYLLTKPYLQVISGAIRQYGLDKVKTEYRQAMAARVDALSIDPGLKEYSRLWAEQDRAQIDSLAEGVTTEGLGELGNSTSGWNGNLHLFSFLYEYIPIPPVSLSRIVEIAAGAIVPLSSLSSVRLVLSYGPSPMFESATAMRASPAGAVRYTFECRYHDGLEDEFDSLESVLKARLLEIHKKIRPGGRLYDSVTLTEDHMSDLAARVLDTSRALLKLENELKLLNSTLESLRKPCVKEAPFQE